MQEKTKKIIKNYVYSLIYDIFIIITPLITAPYVSRVLQSSGMGQYSFSNSITQYFVMFAQLGFNLYAKREMACHQGDKKAQSILFWEILLARFICVIIVLFLYIGMISSGIFRDYNLLLKLLMINIIAVGLDVTFLFHGNEEFGIVVLRNIIIKVLGIASIFAFVKSADDVGIYVLCNSLLLLGSNLSLWLAVPKRLTKVRFREINISKHYLPTIKLFIPTLAISVYTILDKTLIGILVKGTENIIINGNEVTRKISDVENGYYEQADKILKLALTTITSLGNVMITRNSNEYAHGNIQGLKKNVYTSINYTLHLGLPMTFGLAAIALNFSPWFFGAGYEKVPYLIMILSPLATIIGLSNALGIQFLLPKKEDKKYTIAICSGAATNLVLNVGLIYYFGSFGAAVASVAAETVVTVTMLYMAKNQILLKTIIQNGKSAIFGSLIMFIVVFITQRFLSPSIVNTILLFVEGIMIYFIVLRMSKDTFFVMFLNKLKEKKRH